MINANVSVSGQDFDFDRHIGWKYYNHIKKKAMEQEFSWSGLMLSLSIAFFIVICSAYALNLMHSAMSENILQAERANKRVYRLENIDIKTLLQSNKANIQEKTEKLQSLV